MAMIDPYGSRLYKDYEKVMKDFGLEQLPDLPEENRLMRRGVVFASRDLKPVVKAMEERKPFYVLTGIMPTSERIHLGNKMVVENVAYFQKHGAQTYILVADLEAATARGVSLEEAKKRAMDFHIPSYIALGLDPKKTTFYFQSENSNVINFAYEAAKKITLNEFKAVYGSADPGRIMAAVTQVGDILFPQFEERMPGVIPVGIDQDPHIRLTRDVVNRMKDRKFFSPAAIYNKFTPSLDGELKMSKSRPHTCIELPDDPKKVCKKIMRALTGGRESVEVQRKKGGIPEDCMIFELYKQHLIEDDKELQKIHDDCKAGKLLCGEDKQHCCELMERYMKKLKKDIEAARKNVDKLNFIRF
ncbi:MAG: tryptophan--tRNA ligase [Nanoarchaeota archaeon]|nr:tryptophan--tRNA ligase [Nanoarchaeota archaeon]